MRDNALEGAKLQATTNRRTNRHETNSDSIRRDERFTHHLHMAGGQMRENFAWYKGRLIEVTSLPIMCNGVCNGYMQYLRIAEVNHGTYHSGVDCFKKAMELIDAGLEGEWQRRGEGN